MKKIVLLIVVALIAVLVIGCGSDSGSDSEQSPDGGGDDMEEIISEVYSVGEFDVSVPQNWLVVPFMINGDEEDLMTDSVVLYKEATNDISMLNHPSISIFIYDAQHDALNDRIYYDDAEDIEPVVVGDTTFEGFMSDNNGYPIYSVAGNYGDYQFKLILRYDAPKGEISFEDKDVVYIIESLMPTN